MTRQESNFGQVGSAQAVTIKPGQSLNVEIFVNDGFCALEVGAVTRTLALGNQISNSAFFQWKFVSAKPGLVVGPADMMVRAAPAIRDHGFSDIMIVVGGSKMSTAVWLDRARQMTRKGHLVALLSAASTEYIRATRIRTGQVTTHWHDAAILEEAGSCPRLADTLAEKSNGIITSAGQGATAELVLGLISPYLTSPQIAEIGNHLLLPTIRKSDALQPQGVSGNSSLFDEQITKIIREMESNIADPVDMPTLCKTVNMSTRQVERLFKGVFDESPARFYKQLRAKKAWTLIEETVMPLADVAVATGFGSVARMSSAVKGDFGYSPSQLRARNRADLLRFA